VALAGLELGLAADRGLQVAEAVPRSGSGQIAAGFGGGAVRRVEAVPVVAMAEWGWVWRRCGTSR
jgi:hypothetical protein